MKQYLHNLAQKICRNIALLNAWYNHGYRKQSVSKSFGQTSSASLCMLRKEQSSSTCDLTTVVRNMLCCLRINTSSCRKELLFSIKWPVGPFKGNHAFLLHFHRDIVVKKKSQYTPLAAATGYLSTHSNTEFTDSPANLLRSKASTLSYQNCFLVFSLGTFLFPLFSSLELA